MNQEHFHLGLSADHDREYAFASSCFSYHYGCDHDDRDRGHGDDHDDRDRGHDFPHQEC